MIFHDTRVKGAYVIDVRLIEDERGFFARTWSAEDAETRGLIASFTHCSLSGNTTAGTLRGLHYQTGAHAETKLVRCTRGRIYDVVLDLRPDSETFARWDAVELSAANRRSIYIPRGCAHGYLTLEDDSEVAYQITPAYCAEASAGVRWNDPMFGIEWPAAPSVMSDRDRSFPNFESVHATRD
jgi:dTDP-4-dehydrorhamnose 3,5-epimerase